MKERVTITREAKCPWCAGTVQMVANHTLQSINQLHSLPPCEAWVNADPMDVETACRWTNVRTETTISVRGPLAESLIGEAS